MTEKAIPAEMTALRARTTSESDEAAVSGLVAEQVPTPRPGRGQVLIRIEAAPCNPADLLYLTGRYGIDRPFPATPGFEGAGTVVASGGGLLARWLVGKRVACGGHECSGTWAEYCLTDATQCLVLHRALSFEQGATAVANPITALALVGLAKRGHHRAIVQTAAAGYLGRLLERVAKDAEIPVLNVVRRSEQAESLRAAGSHALASDDADFAHALRARARELSATIAFDAVAGPMTGILANALPKRSEVVVYGALAGTPSGDIDPMELAFGEKRVRGFEIAGHLRAIGLFSSFLLANRAQRLVASGATATIRERVPLVDARVALGRYVREMSVGKVLLFPGR
jgi:NADPH:quinone reductase-like Zn-dependent oxidoreductase